LEELVRTLAKVSFDTAEEKQLLATGLRDTLDEWGYRARSPDSGTAAFIRARATAKSPRGFYYFDDASDDSGKTRSAMTPSQLVEFEIVDAPADGRRSKA